MKKIHRHILGFGVTALAHAAHCSLSACEYFGLSQQFVPSSVLHETALVLLLAASASSIHGLFVIRGSLRLACWLANSPHLALSWFETARPHSLLSNPGPVALQVSLVLAIIALLLEVALEIMQGVRRARLRR